MHQEKKLNDIVSPKMPPHHIKVNNVELDENTPTAKNSVNNTPFINNSEKEDNAIFSHQLKQFSKSNTKTEEGEP